jgi:hypothetical protein
MPAMRKLPDDKTLAALHRDGHTTIEIAKQYQCTPSAVSLHWSRLGLEPRRARHATLIPWRVAHEHAHGMEVIYLRLLSRMAAGEEVKDRRCGTAYRWAKNMQGVLAVHYVPGWGWSLQAQTDDDQIVSIKTPLGDLNIALGSVPSTTQE